MFDIGFSELLLIALLALVVLGPQRLPEVARAAGRWIGRLRRFVEEVKREVDRQAGDQDLAALRQIHRELSETRGLLERSAADAFTGLSEAGAASPPPAPPAPIAAAAPARRRRRPAAAAAKKKTRARKARNRRR